MTDACVALGCRDQPDVVVEHNGTLRAVCLDHAVGHEVRDTVDQDDQEVTVRVHD